MTYLPLIKDAHAIDEVPASYSRCDSDVKSDQS